MSGALRFHGLASTAADLLANDASRVRLERVLASAGQTTVDALGMVGVYSSWTHTSEFRCDPAGRPIAGLEVATMMDTHDEMAGTMLVGCPAHAVDDIANVLSSTGDPGEIGVLERMQEVTNIIGSAYLNGIRDQLVSDGFSSRTFLPSPPAHVVDGSVDRAIEFAIGAQQLGDRGWISDHRLRSGNREVVVAWIPSCTAIVTVADRSGAAT